MAQNPLPVQLQLNVQVPTPPLIPRIAVWADIASAFAALTVYLRKLVQFLSQLLNLYASTINLAFGAAQTSVTASVTLPNAATTKIGNVAFNQLVAFAQGDFISFSAQGVIDASMSVNVIVKGDPSGVQISGIPDVTVTSDGSGNFHFADSGSVISTMIGDTSLDFFIANATGGDLTLDSATLGANITHAL